MGTPSQTSGKAGYKMGPKGQQQKGEISEGHSIKASYAEMLKAEPNKGKLLELKSEEISKKKEFKQKTEERAVIEAITKPEKDEKHVQIVVKEDLAVKRDDSNYYSVNREMKRQKQRSVSRSVSRDNPPA